MARGTDVRALRGVTVSIQGAVELHETWPSVAEPGPVLADVTVADQAGDGGDRIALGIDLLA